MNLKTDEFRLRFAKIENLWRSRYRWLFICLALLGVISIELFFPLTSSSSTAKTKAFGKYWDLTTNAEMYFKLRYETYLVFAARPNSTGQYRTSDIEAARQQAAEHLDREYYTAAKCTEEVESYSIVVKIFLRSERYNSCIESFNQHYAIFSKMKSDAQLMNSAHAQKCLTLNRLYEDEVRYPVAKEFSNYIQRDRELYNYIEVIDCLKAF